MSYAYLFKYIIIGDTGNFTSFSTLLIFDPYKTWVSELLYLADLGLRLSQLHQPAVQFVGNILFAAKLWPLQAWLMHTCTLQEAEAILEDLSPSPLQIFGFGVALLAVPYALLASGRLRSTSTISLNFPAYTKQVFHQQ
ncbi:calcium sensing receptor, chloroplastic isoform X2 [Senna tora]|uniref:Calcium sensing receptor, chloroplastic isoform X2 n=1 Tax=Senna tora TaxID=362788 RepID=A0A835CE39_9FABA|nr:calcium sensing receptor, chloroplastic isoform X2 [Senna tora]